MESHWSRVHLISVNQICVNWMSGNWIAENRLGVDHFLSLRLGGFRFLKLAPVWIRG